MEGYEIMNYIQQNRKQPDYPNLNEYAIEQLYSKDKQNDFWLSTKCFYVTDDGDVPVTLTLKRNELHLVSKLGYGEACAQKMRELDPELFEKEIEGSKT